MTEAKTLPIEYVAIIAQRDGREREIDLDTPGWLNDADVATALTFTLKPKDGAELPVVGVHLSALPDGKPKKLVYFSRVFGRVETNASELVSSAQTPYFRLYCIGWEAEFSGRKLRSVSWVYPGGSVVAADEPPYVDEMLDHYSAARKLEQEQAAGQPA